MEDCPAISLYLSVDITNLKACLGPALVTVLHQGGPVAMQTEEEKKCPETGETTKSVLKWEKTCSPISRPFLSLEIREKVSINRENDKKCLEIREKCLETGETKKVSRNGRER